MTSLNYHIYMVQDYKYLNSSRYSSLLKNGMACKDKWGVLYGDFIGLFAYINRTNHNTKYLDLTPQEKRALSFNRLQKRYV